MAEHQADGRIVYLDAALTVEQFNAEIAAFWTQVDVDPALQHRLEEVGLEVGALSVEDRAHLLVARPGPAAFGDPASVAVVFAFIVARDAWKKIILPRLLEKWGPESVGKEEQPDDHLKSERDKGSGSGK